MGKSLEIANSDNSKSMRLQVTTCRKKSTFLRFFFKTRADTQQALPVQIDLYRKDE